MIHFRSVTYKNFLSTGNQPTTILLDRVPSVLITGHNGAGKSTVLDAISFGLYGKPYRNINKPQLLNTVNEKNLEVVIEFKVNEIDFKIVRGLKPTVFEIYRNDVLVPHDAAAKDYQKRLEDILGLNYKAFSQIVILGSARYQSFMDLSTNDRRTIIEEILDITVFSKMNSVLKTRVQTTELEIRENDYERDLVKTKMSSQKGLIKNLTNRAKESVEKIESEKARYQLELDTLNTNISLLDEEINGLVVPNIEELHDKMSEVKIKGNELQRRERTANDRITFYENAHTCETCHQEIGEDIKEDQINLMKLDLESVNKIKIPMAEAFKKLDEKIATANELKANHVELSAQRRELTNEKKTIESVMRDLKVTTTDTDEESLIEAKNDYEQLEKELKNNEIENIRLVEVRHNHDICKILLKDDGIKAKIIKQYLPVMNNLINKFLDRMGANYSFHLDESFNEIIKSRYRDSFSYASFSEGEKQRIDLALMFTWREIAKIKNSVATNLLILDEIGDSSMDGEGTDVLWEILNDMTDTNIFVISHKTSNVDKFTSHIEFQKEGNFSKIINSK